MEYETGKIDEDTGVGEVADTIPYTFEHVDEPPISDENFYRIECYIHFTEIAFHKNVYYVPAHLLEEWFINHSEVGEIVIDVRPISEEDAKQELDEYTPNE